MMFCIYEFKNADVNASVELSFRDLLVEEEGKSGASTTDLAIGGAGRTTYYRRRKLKPCFVTKQAAQQTNL